MDPNAAYQRWKRAVARGDMEEASEAWRDLNGWMRRGGFPPDWSPREQAAFRDWSPRSKNPLVRYIAYVSAPPGSDVSKSFLAGAVTGSRPFKSMVAAKRFAVRMQRLGWHVVIRSAKKNPLSPTTEKVLIGVGVVGTAALALFWWKNAQAQAGPSVVVVSAGATQTIVNPAGANVELPAGATWVSASGFDLTNVNGKDIITTATPFWVPAGTATVLAWNDPQGQQQSMNLNVNATG